MKLKLFSRLATALAVSAVAVGLAPAGVANAATNCDYSFTTKKFGCNGASKVRASTDVIGARIFTGTDYTGDMLTVWVPRPCPKNDKVDHMLALNSSVWRNRVSSAQAWSTCWVWLYQSDGSRHGPFTGNNPDLRFADRTIKVGLS